MGLFSKLKENIEKSKERQKMMMEKRKRNTRGTYTVPVLRHCLL